MRFFLPSFSFFFFNDTATTEIYTLSLHDALPIWHLAHRTSHVHSDLFGPGRPDRKSTRLNSSHHSISYAVFCLKKKKERRKNAGTKCNGAEQRRGERRGLTE